jgi:hypothetical protein
MSSRMEKAGTFVRKGARGRISLATSCAMTAVALAAGPFGGEVAYAQIKSCDSSPKPPFCNAVRGDRAEGWIPQTRSEVVARNGIVSTSQALAAEAGMEILKQGGNAIDAAVAAAAVLNLIEPTSTGVGADVFAVIYIASDSAIQIWRRRSASCRSSAATSSTKVKSPRQSLRNPTLWVVQ